MKKHVLFVLCLIFINQLFAQQTPNTETLNADRLLSPRANGFRKNLGQIQAPNFQHQIFYTVKTPGLDLYVTDKGISYFLYKKKSQQMLPTEQAEKGFELVWERMEMLLDKAEIKKENCIEIKKSITRYNYFTADFPDGLYDVPEYQELLIKNVYDGIDWHLYFTEDGRLKYDFIVNSGADADQIRLHYLSPEGTSLKGNGDLNISAKEHALTEQAPYTYIRSDLKQVESRFVIESQQQLENCKKSIVSFKLGNYLNTQTLVIDPTLYWSTSFGGSFNDRSKGIVSDVNGNIYITGFTQSTDFIVQNAGTYFQGTGFSSGKAFVMKFNRALALVWSTFYGGSNNADVAMCIAIDRSQQIYISGYTYTNNFPLQSNGGFIQNSYGGNCDAFLVKFDTTGTRKWATYYGGSELEFGLSLACDQTGAAYVGGITYSSNFPLQNQGAFFQGTAPAQGNSTGFIVKFDNTGARKWATYYDSNRINAIATDASNHLLVTGFTYGSTHTVNPGGGAYFQNIAGYQSFVGRFTEGGTLVWATYYGGSNSDDGKSIIADRHGNIFIAGITRSTNIPLVGDENAYQYAAPTSTLPFNNVVDAYLAKFDSTGVLTWATYYGSTGYDEMSTFQNFAVDACDRVYFTLESSPNNTLSISTQSACEGGYIKTVGTNYDQHIVRFSNNGARQWASILGGDGPDVGSAICVDPNGDLFITGNWDPTSSTTYTYVNPGGSASFSTNPGSTSQSFVAKFIGSVLTTPPQYIYPTICSNLTSSMYPQFTNSFVPGGTFTSSSPNLTVNAISGLITLANTPPGNYTISYSSLSCTCDNSKLQVAIQDCSGVDEHARNSRSLEVYPNPNSGKLTVTTNAHQSLIITNALGEVVMVLPATQLEKTEIDLSALENGIYFISSKDNSTVTKPIVIMR